MALLVTLTKPVNSFFVVSSFERARGEEPPTHSLFFSQVNSLRHDVPTKQKLVGLVEAWLAKVKLAPFRVHTRLLPLGVATPTACIDP